MLITDVVEHSGFLNAYPTDAWQNQATNAARARGRLGDVTGGFSHVHMHTAPAL